MPRPAALPLAIVLLAANVASAEKPLFECGWADGGITVDGRADEAAWKRAQTIDRFTLPWLGEDERPARTATKARLLWDRDGLYFFAEMEDSDLYAFTDEHDGELWHGDVFELFFKPAADEPGYYEFQVNPAGAVLDVFMPRRGAGGFQRFKSEVAFGVQAQPVLRGTLGKWQDRDDGWSVEGKIPWKGFRYTGGAPEAGAEWTFALCRYDYSVAFDGPELSTCAPLSKRNFHHFEDYARLRFVGPNSAGR